MNLIDTLFINLCMVVALSYLISLTYVRWKVVEDSWKFKLLRATLAGASSILLMAHGLHFQNMLILDLKLLPLLLIGLRYGPIFLLISSVPVVAYRLTLLQDLPSEVFLLAFSLFVLVLMLTHKKVTQDIQPYLTVSALSLLVYHLAWFLAPTDPRVLMKTMFPSFVFNMLGFTVAMMVIRVRILYLKATHNLLTEAQTDPLTGNFNRRQFEEDLQQIQIGDVLLVLDLDHFKQINDQYGHQTGDHVLQQFSEVLRSCTRSRDRIYRMGGEEFLVVLRGITPAGAEVVAERIRSRVASHLFGGPGHLTVSGGWSVIGSGDTVLAALHQADQLLYQAKASGRNAIRGNLNVDGPVLVQEG